jgi:hypothetical protein
VRPIHFLWFFGLKSIRGFQGTAGKKHETRRFASIGAYRLRDRDKYLVRLSLTKAIDEGLGMRPQRIMRGLNVLVVELFHGKFPFSWSVSVVRQNQHFVQKIKRG